MTPNWSRICMYNVPLGLIVRARRAVSSGIVSGSGGGNDIKRLLSLLQTEFSYSTRFSFPYAWLGNWATESMYVLGQISKFLPQSSYGISDNAPTAPEFGSPSVAN